LKLKMASEVLPYSETLFALAILLALLPLIVKMALSDRPDPHLEFLLNLAEGFPKSDAP
jgi:hypothetical protein